MKHTHKALKAAYDQFFDLRIAVRRRALEYFVSKGFTVRDGQVEDFLESWHFRSVFRALLEASLDDMYGRDNWRIVKLGTGNRAYISCLRESDRPHTRIS